MPFRRLHGSFEARNDHAVGLTLDRPSSFGTDNANQIYVTQLSGLVVRLEPSG